jgi:predicted phage replisome organizer
MSEVKWIKIKVDIFNDEKIQLIETMPDADTIIVIWFKLLALAGIKNDGGIVRMNDKMAYTDDMLATIFRRKVSVIILALETFRQFDMIDIVDNKILINNWEKHQNVDGLDKIKLQNKERQQKYRDNQKTLLLENKKEDIDSKSKRTPLRVTQRNVTKKTKYLEFVLLTDDEHNKLKEKFNSRLPNLIENLNNYIGSTGKKYKSHYHTILSWERKNDKQETKTENKYEQYESINGE